MEELFEGLDEKTRHEIISRVLIAISVGDKDPMNIAKNLSKIVDSYTDETERAFCEATCDIIFEYYRSK